MNGFIFSARGGELLSNRPEDQEMAILSLHLIQVSLALINTLLLQEVLAEEKWDASMKPEDWRGLMPLFYQHVNSYGRFTLDLTQRLPFVAHQNCLDLSTLPKNCAALIYFAATRSLP